MDRQSWPWTRRDSAGDFANGQEQRRAARAFESAFAQSGEQNPRWAANRRAGLAIGRERSVQRRDGVQTAEESRGNGEEGGIERWGKRRNADKRDVFTAQRRQEGEETKLVVAALPLRCVVDP